MDKQYFRISYSPYTYELFLKTSMNKTGIVEYYKNSAKKVNVGDILIVYLIGISRFCGLFEVSSKFKIDRDSVYFRGDEFTLVCDIKNVIWLPIENTLSIFNPEIWNNFSITRGLEKDNKRWVGSFLSGFMQLKKSDGELLERLITDQNINRISFPLNQKETDEYKRKKESFIKKFLIKETEEHREVIELKSEAKHMEESLEVIEVKSEKKYNESSIIQAYVSKIGKALGFKIWVPNHDKVNIKEISKLSDDDFLESLPIDASKIIKQIDVLWVNKKLVVRAFEIEGTTAIYSGILRMCDLIEENPNTNTKLHIVASSSRKEEVFREFSRPTFQKLQSHCSYISYEEIIKLAEQEKLEFYKESIIDSICEYPDIIE